MIAAMVPVEFSRAPFIVIWEVTRACALACVHCRADAIARRDPHELTTAEGFRLIDQIKSFGAPLPLLVLTGGDPMWRKDLAELVGYATAGRVERGPDAERYRRGDEKSSRGAEGRRPQSRRGEP